MSYPYVEYEGYKFSLIEPFTVNDMLIVDIDINVNNEVADIMDQNTMVMRYNRNYESYMVLKLHTGGRLCFRLNSNCFNSDNAIIIRDIIQEYMSMTANINPYILRECQYILRNARYILTYLLSDIQRQCEHLRNGYNLSSYDNELMRQGRPRFTSEYSWGTINSSDLISVTSNVNDFRYDTIGTIGQLKKDRIIHYYAYIPEYKKHYLSGEDETTTLLLGAEIEVDCGGESEEHAKKVLEIMNGKETWNSEENIYCVHDGSLTEKSLDSLYKKVTGMEFPTQPASLAYHKTLPYKEMFKYLDENGYKAHDTKTCGLHIHINRSFFGENELECIGKLMYIIEKFNDEFSIIGRRSCQYARMLGYNGEKCKELYQKGSRFRDKYNAINLLHTDTIEIRAFKGTLKYSTFMNTLEFVSDLAHFVKNHTEEEVENMNWSDLYNTFSDDLKKYYDERKKIESEKKKEEKYKQENVERREITFSCENAIWDANLLRSMIGVDSDIYNVYFSESEEPKEKKLKRLKKQLKTEQKYMTKQELKRQIQELQKEIKQEKKRKKQNTSN